MSTLQDYCHNDKAFYTTDSKGPTCFISGAFSTFHCDLKHMLLEIRPFFCYKRQTKDKRRVLIGGWNFCYRLVTPLPGFFFLSSLTLSGRLVSAFFFPLSEACKVQQSFSFNRKQKRGVWGRKQCRRLSSIDWISAGRISVLWVSCTDYDTKSV